VSFLARAEWFFEQKGSKETKRASGGARLIGIGLTQVLAFLRCLLFKLHFECVPLLTIVPGEFR
jgi:hypothetical protein